VDLSAQLDAAYAKQLQERRAGLCQEGCASRRASQASGHSQGCDWAQNGTADGTYVGNSPRVVGWGATNLANQTAAMMNGSVEANVIRTP
jgi:hypothetical protein